MNTAAIETNSAAARAIMRLFVPWLTEEQFDRTFPAFTAEFRRQAKRGVMVADRATGKVRFERRHR